MGIRSLLRKLEAASEAFSNAEVSVPFFIIIYGFLYMTREEESGPEHDESGLNRAEEQPQVPEDDVPIPPASGEP